VSIAKASYRKATWAYNLGAHIHLLVSMSMSKITENILSWYAAKLNFQICIMEPA
jgi:hypothetical protein